MSVVGEELVELVEDRLSLLLEGIPLEVWGADIVSASVSLSSVFEPLSLGTAFLKAARARCASFRAVRRGRLGFSSCFSLGDSERERLGAMGLRGVDGK